MITRTCAETDEPCQRDCGPGECLASSNQLYDHFRSIDRFALTRCAEDCGVSRRYLGRIAKGKGWASQDLAARIAAWTGLPADTICQSPVGSRRTTTKSSRTGPANSSSLINSPANGAKLLKLPWDLDGPKDRDVGHGPLPRTSDETITTEERPRTPAADVGRRRSA